jgi:hypothetical protein
MAINQNHLFEELNGVKCAIVEKNVSAARVGFLRSILEYNRYTVVVVASPPPKAAPAAPGTPAAEPSAAAATPPPAETPVAPALPPAPETFTVGVTDVSFNSTNAIFGRLLKTPDGRIVTLAYWQQKDAEAHDDIPYFGAV